jgi:effector-binding domain-containing protein
VTSTAGSWERERVSPDVEVVTLSARPAVAIRAVIPMDQLDVGEVFGAALGRLFPYIGQHGLSPAGAPYARYAEFGPERADIEIGVPLVSPPGDLPPLRPDDELGSTELPGGEAASYRHIGPYPDLGQAYQTIEAWMKDSGRSPAGAPWESYEVGPDQVDDDTSRLETVVCWPLT